MVIHQNYILAAADQTTYRIRTLARDLDKVHTFHHFMP